MTIKVFLDSDVVISALLSSLGAAYSLIYKTANVAAYISNISVKELDIVARRLNIDHKALQIIVHKHCKLIKLKQPNKELQVTYKDYVSDENDAHIVAGAVSAKASFLITYNQKHYKIDKIKSNLKIKIMPPGLFLQYLRSQ